MKASLQLLLVSVVSFGVGIGAAVAYIRRQKRRANDRPEAEGSHSKLASTTDPGKVLSLTLKFKEPHASIKPTNSSTNDAILSSRGRPLLNTDSSTSEERSYDLDRKRRPLYLPSTPHTVLVSAPNFEIREGGNIHGTSKRSNKSTVMETKDAVSSIEVSKVITMRHTGQETSERHTSHPDQRYPETPRTKQAPLKNQNYLPVTLDARVNHASPPDTATNISTRDQVSSASVYTSNNSESHFKSEFNDRAEHFEHQGSSSNGTGSGLGSYELNGLSNRKYKNKVRQLMKENRPLPPPETIFEHKRLLRAIPPPEYKKVMNWVQSNNF